MQEHAATTQKLQDTLRDIQRVYKEYPYPWVIGYSGGKDSTATLQLIWQALSQLPPAQRTKPVHVISTDTLVETPVIVDYVTETLNKIRKAAIDQGIPFKVHRLTPMVSDTFWVNLIGRGYPAPNSIFRWCTRLLKIEPSNRFILEQVAEHGEVILALGMRRGESAKRDGVVKEHHYHWHTLSRHGQLPNAWVYLPIEDFTVEDVWNYLLQVRSPWEGNNRLLRALYRSANDGECPLVIDDTTKPCGNSRFGCWVCTVVEHDHSMEAMIDSGEEWMVPFLDFRDWLASTQDPKVKSQQREYKGRNGQVRITDRGLLWRTYTLDFSREILRRLLETQADVRKSDPDFTLISLAELREIRRLWLAERQDWEDSLPRIYADVTGHATEWEISDISTPGRLELDLLQQCAAQHDVPTKLLQKLIDAEWQYHGMRRRGLVHKTIEAVFREDWRSLEEVQEAVVERHGEAHRADELA